MRLRMFLAAALLAGASLAAGPAPRATVTAAADAEGMVLTYELGQPVTSLEFANGAGPIRGDAWQVLTPGVTLADRTLSAAQPVRRIQIRVKPEGREIDRVYPSLVRLGNGFVVHGPYLALKGLDTRLQLKPANGHTAVAAARPLEAVIYVGPKAYVTPAAGARIIAANDLPGWIRARVPAEAAAGMAFYQTALKAPDTTPATLIIGRLPARGMSLRADVTGGRTVFFRFSGDGWERGAPDVQREADKVVLHEAFHLWDPGGGEESKSPWLHEGAAEYGSIVAAASLGLYGEADALAEVARHMSVCREALQDKPLADGGVLRGSAVYGCGTTLQWLADLDARQAGSDFFTVWGGMFRDRPAAGYTVAQFRAALPASGGLAIRLLDQSGPERWPALEAALRTRGVTLLSEPQPDSYRAAILFHLESQHCAQGEPIGYFTQPDAVKLDTTDRCGPLSGDPEIVAIEGHDILARAAAGYAAAAARCAAGKAVVLQRKGGGEIAAPCARPAPAPTPSYRIEKAPPLMVAARRA